MASVAFVQITNSLDYDAFISSRLLFIIVSTFNHPEIYKSTKS